MSFNTHLGVTAEPCRSYDIPKSMALILIDIFAVCVTDEHGYRHGVEEAGKLCRHVHPCRPDPPVRCLNRGHAKCYSLIPIAAVLFQKHPLWTT